MSDPTHPAPPPAATEPPVPPPADAAAEPASPRPPPTAARQAPTAPPVRSAGAVLAAIAVFLLAGGLAWVWTEQQQLAATAVAPADVAALREQLRTLQQRLAQLEQRPAPRAAAPVDLRPLEARLAALEQRPAEPPAADPALAGRLATLDQRIAQAEQAAARTVRIAVLERAAAALAAGQPLGAIPGAPPALARFAAAPPPTEPALRRAFAEAATQARAASRAEAAATGIAERAWQRLRALVTVRSGDTVLLGAPAAIVLGQAAERLARDDLAGAVAALDALDPGAAAAIAGWRAEAEALLAARAALAAMRAA